MWRIGTWLAAIFAVLIVGTARPAHALDIPPVPPDFPIADQTSTLTADQRASLGATIAAETKTSSNQIAIVVIRSLDGEAIEDYSLRVARQWGVGDKSHNNGVLLTVALNDHKMRIEVGYGLEGALTDARCSRIIRNDMAPQFRAGHYYEGIRVGLDGIIKSIHNEYVARPNPQAGNTLGNESAFWLVVIPLIWISAILARTKSWWAGGVLGAGAGGAIGMFYGFVYVGLLSIVGLTTLGLLLDMAVSRNYQRHGSSGGSPSWWAGGTRFGGGFGGGRSGGGFGGFGGGGFGGGGSSGGW